VELVQGDARRTGLARSSFDLVHARLLLVNIPDPTAVVSEMVRLARPGGWVAGQEADGLFLCHPPHPAHNRLSEVFRTIYEQDGADVHVGRRLPELYRAAGLVDVGIEAHAEVYPVGQSRRTILPDLVRSIRAKIIERGVLAESELDELDQAVRAHLGDPGTLTVPYLLFSVWGRKPADPASQGDS
jgi:SAM-dependent methyltransferase